MNKKHRILRFTLTLVSLLLAITMLSSCGIINLLLVNAVSTDSSVNISSLAYERPDFEKIKKAFDDVTIDIKNQKKNQFSLQLALSNAFELYNDAMTQYSLIQLQYSDNVTDTEAENEVNYCAEEFAKLDIVVNNLYIAIIDAGYKDSLLYGFTEDDFELIEVKRKMFDSEYPTLMAERTRLENEYSALSASIVFKHTDGKDYNINDYAALYQNGKITIDDYRAAVETYYTTLSAQSAPIYQRLIEIDNTLAAKADFDSYSEYSYRYVYQRDYTPDQSKTMYRYVINTIIPLYFEVNEMIDWEILGAVFAKTDATIENYDQTLKEYTAEISPTMKDAYSFLKKNKLANIGNHENMQTGSYTTYLPSYEVPYIHLYTYGDIDDINTFVHEFGHFYAFYYNKSESDSIIDVSEIHSQANEWLFLPYYDLNEEERTQYALYRISETLSSIIEGCLFDEFQQYMYENIDNIAGVDDINKAFETIAKKYRYDEIYGGNTLPYLWSVVHHNFVAPFYYISYAVSAVAALEIFEVSEDNRAEAIKIYNGIVDETGFRSYLTVLEDAGLTSPFTADCYSLLRDFVETYIESKITEEKTAA